MKFIISENQYNLLELYKKGYSLDWDDNILFMPTKIHLEKLVDGNWEPYDVSTEEFREVRSELGDNLRTTPTSFKDFQEYEAFINDTIQAINDQRFGPSYDKFKKSLINIDDFSIITARGNPIKALKDGIKVLIKLSFSPLEKNEMKNNLQEKGITLDEYLDGQDLQAVSSPEFQQKYGKGEGATKPEEAKTIAFKEYVKRVVKSAKTLIDNPEFKGISIGFSDDDLGNVKKMESFIREILSKKYPNVNFVVYDTSDPKNIKKKRINIKLD